ncbi:AEC family transporter [Poseidonibacter lekithochrous]|uniref:AEC family transporter n=1 Tax=Poseidonibacter lekithochrous TaxID=1904463 RepID=UPI0008FC84E7|nr:AEC family transporter [Poseidonibacter lekithochrous]QKJ22944.1 putative permease [Poseidonibacter lekithochrous]
MENFALIAIAILVGYVLQKFKIFPEETSIILNKYIIYIPLPAIILLQVPKLTFSFDVLIPTIIAWLVMAFTALIVLFFARIYSWSKEITGSLLLVSILTNSSIMGIPIIELYLGEESLPYVLIYDQLGTFLALAAYGTFVTAYYSASGNIHAKVIVQKIITFPSFIALIFALLLLGQEFNPLITGVLGQFAATLVPVALVSVGLQLQFKLPKDDLKPLSIALLIKLILAPLIAIGICYLFGWNNLAGKASIFEAGMAPMITAGAMASMAGLAPRLSVAIVGYGIIFSFLTTYILSLIIV